MKEMLIYEIESGADCKILTWPKNRPIQYIVRNPDELERNCLYFYSEKDEEISLLEKLVTHEASGVVVPDPCKFDLNKWRNAGIGIIETDNLIMFQISLAKIYRMKFEIPFVQVIGSAGKTTTKDMIGSVLNAGMKTLVGYGNYNTAYGAASNILSLRDTHKAAVIEAGTQSKDYMSFSTGIIQPQIAVLTSIQRAHYVKFGSIEKIIEAKAEILNYLDENSVLIMNGEDSNCDRFPVENYKGRILKFGFTDNSNLWASDIVYKDFKTYFTAHARGINENFVINTIGQYNVANALAAILVGLEFKMHSADIRRGLADFIPMTGRMRIYSGPDDTILVDDNFNANPDSTQLLLQEIPKFAEGRPIILVIGDIERPDDLIKPYAQEVHHLIGQQIAQINFYKLIAIGKWAEEYVKGAQENGVSPSKMSYFRTVEEAAECFKSSIIPGSIIVFKASVYVSVSELINSLDNDRIKEVYDFR